MRLIFINNKVNKLASGKFQLPSSLMGIIDNTIIVGIRKFFTDGAIGVISNMSSAPTFGFRVSSGDFLGDYKPSVYVKSDADLSADFMIGVRLLVKDNESDDRPYRASVTRNKNIIYMTFLLNTSMSYLNSVGYFKGIRSKKNISIYEGVINERELLDLIEHELSHSIQGILGYDNGYNKDEYFSNHKENFPLYSSQSGERSQTLINIANNMRNMLMEGRENLALYEGLLNRDIGNIIKGCREYYPEILQKTIRNIYDILGRAISDFSNSQNNPKVKKNNDKKISDLRNLVDRVIRSS